MRQLLRHVCETDNLNIILQASCIPNATAKDILLTNQEIASSSGLLSQKTASGPVQFTPSRFLEDMHA